MRKYSAFKELRPEHCFLNFKCVCVCVCVCACMKKLARENVESGNTMKRNTMKDLVHYNGRFGV